VSGGEDILKPWIVLEEEPLLEVRRLRVSRQKVRLQDGRIVDDYYQLQMGRAAVIAATRGDGRLVLLRMYKHGPRRSGLGFPGGGIEHGESPLDAARRELSEETGFGGGIWQELGDYTVHSNQGAGHLYFFAARNVEAISTPTADDLEPHQFVFVTREEVSAAVRGNEFLSLGHVCLAALWLHRCGPASDAPE
jgi:ADP-ribose pyrophosphatase